jgi:hypothetical protein
MSAEGGLDSGFMTERPAFCAMQQHLQVAETKQ